MSGRGLLFVMLIAGAVGGSYLLAKTENRQKITSWWQSIRGKSDEEDFAYDWPNSASLGQYASDSSTPFRTAPVASGSPSPRLHTPSQQTLLELFRLDVTPDWIVNNWPRVTTQLRDGELEGMRVTLVTGTSVQDLAGSLTYYFDRQRRLQRISFHGHTGDPRPLVTLVTQHYGMRPEPELGALAYAAKWNGRPTSVLHIQHSPIVRSDSPFQKVQVDLELNAPGAPYGLSDEFKQYASVSKKKKAFRWWWSPRDEGDR